MTPEDTKTLWKVVEFQECVAAIAQLIHHSWMTPEEGQYLCTKFLGENLDILETFKDGPFPGR